MLEDRGYRVSTVPAGASMRDFLRTDDRVEAIVLNAVTPGESGASLACHAKDLGLPVVMISGSNDEISFAAEHGLPLLRKPLRRMSSTARSTGRSLAVSSASGAHDAAAANNATSAGGQEVSRASECNCGQVPSIGVMKDLDLWPE